MVRFIAWIAVCVLLGAIVGFLAAPLGDAGWLLIAALIAAILVAPTSSWSTRGAAVTGNGGTWRWRRR